MITIEIHQEALKAAEQACADFESNHPNFRDACGFSWVDCFEKGNTKMGKSFVRVGFSKSYTGGYTLWNPGGTNSQSISLKEAGTQAYVETVKKYLPEAKIYASSRMD
jgi:hypothetical protein